MTDLDVAIVGGGLAGNLLARQLLRALPGARVGVFERETQRAYKVGEATVEIAASHLIRRQGLTGYLYENHLPKNGLRYFFDTPERDASLEDMSEIGSINLPFHPAFQLDRARLEADLLEMNAADGAQVRTGVRVCGIELGSGGDAHRFEVEDAGGRRSAHSARWLVDAAGRSGLLARQQELREPEPRHRIGSAWARFEGVVDIDALGSESWRARVRHTSRRLSTLHFWYPGYWVWVIPLRGGLTSVGVTGDIVRERRDLRTADGFQSFLLEHAALAELLAPAKAVDFGCYARIAYGTKRFVSPDRWALCGEAATSADPLYSPGTDFIALENDYVTDLVAREAGGASAAELSRRTKLYDAFVRFRHDATMLLYTDLYGGLGSFDLARIKWTFDIGCYYNLWVSSYMLDEHLDPEALRQQLKLRGPVLRALRNFSKLFQRTEALLRERGDYFRANTGRFHYGLSDIEFADEIGAPRSQEQVFETTFTLFDRVRRQLLELGEPERSAGEIEPLPLQAYFRPGGLA